MIILGSGGHTTEMIKFLTNYNFNKYRHTLVLYAEGDIFSRHKFEKSFRVNHGIELSEIEKQGKLTFSIISRSRKVHQSFITAVFTTIYATLGCFKFYITSFPDTVKLIIIYIILSFVL